MENNEKFNLEDIKNIEPEEFKKQISDWVEEKGINKILQSRLRRDLIESFNRTSLGRKMTAEYQTSHRMVLSPLILAMNTLVAEFLYAQNCHFSLSVFSSEVPFKNTLPNFENEQQFRFNKTELEEIFEAIGIEGEEVCKEYQASDLQNDRKSLLFCLLKYLCHKFKTKSDPVVKAEVELPKQVERSCEKLDSTDLKNLNLYLDKLSSKMKEMSKELKKLQNKNESSDQIKPASFEKLEFMNKSLERITHDVRMIDQASIEGRQVSGVVRSVDRLSRRLERSLEKSVKQFEHYSNETQRLQTSNENIVPYKTWVKEMKRSENGKRFMEKIKTSLSKTLKKEKIEFEKEFKEKIENEKSIMKLHYKQKLLEKSILEEPKPLPLVEPLKPKYIEIYPSIPPQRKETNLKHIVEDVKHRLKVLEKEDENLDKSFQHYLNNQTNENRQIQGYYQKIFENLNVEQNVLFNKNLVPTMYYPPKEQKVTSEVTPINWDLKEKSIEDEIKYENPFRVFKPKIVVQETREVPIKTSVRDLLSEQPSKNIEFKETMEVPIKTPLRDLLSSQPSKNIEFEETREVPIKMSLRDLLPSQPSMNIELEEIPTKPLEVMIPKIGEKQEDDPQPVFVIPDKIVEVFRPISPKIIIVSPEKVALAPDVTRQVDKKFLSEIYDKNSSESEGQIILSTGDKSSSDEFWK